MGTSTAHLWAIAYVLKTNVDLDRAKLIQETLKAVPSAANPIHGDPT